MGHTRIGRMGRSKTWREVCAFFDNNAAAGTVAIAVLDAVHKSFNYERLANDLMFTEATGLLVQLGIASQSKDFAGHLRDIGLDVSDNPSLPEVKSAIDNYMDDVCWKSGAQRTDLGEVAKQALLGALQTAVNKHGDQLLWNPSQEDYQTAFKHLGKAEEFSQLGAHYFGDIMSRSLQVYLSKELPARVGVSDRIRSIHELELFNKELKKHCMETAVVVKDFSTEWLGLHKHKLNDISKKKISGFATYGLEKMFKAMKYGKD